MNSTDDSENSEGVSDTDEEWDEDVVLPNSPLCDYIKDLDISDSDLMQEENEPAVQSEILIKNLSDKGDFKHFNISIKEKVLSVINIMYSVFLSHVYVIEHYLTTYVLEKIISKNLLIEEDKAFLLNWNSGKQTFRIWDLLRQIFIVITLTLFAVSFILFTLMNLNTDQIISSIFADWQAMICIYPCFGCLLLLAFNTIEIFQCFLMYYRLKNLSRNMHNLYSVVKKCIRLIQESELIARGFTAASVCSLAERLELSSNLPIASTQRQYIELRKYVFSWLKDILMQYRYATSTLIDRVSPDLEFDFTSNYLAKLNIKEFGLILQYDTNSDTELEELKIVTDNFSIMSLKTMFDLMEIQVSEFFKCLYLSSTIHTERRSKSYGLLQTVESSERRTDVTVLNKNMKILLDKIEEKYKYYRCFEVMNVSVPKKNNSSGESGLLLTIHNMSLHLKSALSRLIEIEDRFGDKCLIFENSKNKSVVKEINSLLQIVKSETSAFEDCFSKCNELVTEIIDDKVKKSLDDARECTVTDEDDGMESFNQYIEQCDDEIDVQDEVYEDVISKSNCTSDDIKVFHQEDCTKNLKLLKELKNVLVIKAEEHQNREKIALCRRKGQKGLKDDDMDSNDNINSMSKADSLSDFRKKNNILDFTGRKQQRVGMFKIDNNSDDSITTSKESAIFSQNISNLRETYNESDISSETESETENSNNRLGFLLDQKCKNSKFVLGDRKDSFAAAIASMAAQQRLTLGLSNEEFGCDDDEVDSEN
ncbi:vezatin isoform X1 [Parasteatoda tepidariorum]|uniref:vezatin isoform X1 n=1 Tax=Parasteatoda tepidariorum TaxID=114398 RepID=UPI0039BCD211